MTKDVRFQIWLAVLCGFMLGVGLGMLAKSDDMVCASTPSERVCIVTLDTGKREVVYP